MSEETTETVAVAAEETPIATPKSIDDLKPKMRLKGTVKRLELYGAFIDIGLDINALIHISQLSNERVNRVSDVLNVGDEVEVWVDKVDPQRQQIMVSMVEPLEVEWSDLQKGQAHTGRVTRLENFGAFVDIGAEREGLVHISELSHDFVKQPSEVVQVGDEVQVQVLGFSKRKRRIDLSMKALMEKPEGQYKPAPSDLREIMQEEEEEVGELPTAMEIAWRMANGEDETTAVRTKGKKRKENRKRRRRAKRQAQKHIYDRTLHLERE